MEASKMSVLKEHLQIKISDNCFEKYAIFLAWKYKIYLSKLFFDWLAPQNGSQNLANQIWSWFFFNFKSASADTRTAWVLPRRESEANRDLGRWVQKKGCFFSFVLRPAVATGLFLFYCIIPSVWPFMAGNLRATSFYVSFHLKLSICFNNSVRLDLSFIAGRNVILSLRRRLRKNMCVFRPRACALICERWDAAVHLELSPPPTARRAHPTSSLAGIEAPQPCSDETAGAAWRARVITPSVLLRPRFALVFPDLHLTIVVHSSIFSAQRFLISLKLRDKINIKLFKKKQVLRWKIPGLWLDMVNNLDPTLLSTLWLVVT